MICARIETSSAETGSSSTISRAEVAGTGDGDALALAAAELVREELGLLGTEADELERLGHALAHLLAREPALGLERLGDDVADSASAG